VKLEPFVRVDTFDFDLTPEALHRRLGPPLHQRRNEVALTAHDYGHVVFRFQDCGRLEEITMKAPVLHLGEVAVPFASLEGFVRGHDAELFERAGFLVSPALGLAFVPGDPPWVTALARHGLPQWRAI